MATYTRYADKIVSSDPNSDAVSYAITTDVLNGMTFESAGKKYGMTKQAANKRFWLTVVNRPFSTILGGSIKDLSELRERWNGFYDQKN